MAYLWKNCQKAQKHQATKVACSFDGDLISGDDPLSYVIHQSSRLCTVDAVDVIPFCEEISN